MKKSLLSFLFVALSIIIANAQLSFSKEQHDFGTSVLGTSLEYEFQYVNYSSETALINFVKTSCSCLKPSWSKSSVAIGEVGELKVTFLPTKLGSYSEEVFVYINNNPNPITISVVGSIVETTNTPRSVIQEPFKPKVETNSAPVGNNTNVEIPNTYNQSTTVNNDLFTNIAPDFVGDEVLNTAKEEVYLTYREKAMIKEINLVRSNPTAYVYVVESYIQQLQNTDSDKFKLEITTAYELIEELKRTPKLPVLMPSLPMYNSAKAHGKQAAIVGSLNHVGLDGSLPWDRIMAADASMKDGNENIVGGLKDIRRTVLTLLVDSGIEGRGHRKNILKESWTHIAVYEVGHVGDIPYMWLQVFGSVGSLESSATPDNAAAVEEVRVVSKPAVENYPPKEEFVPKSVDINVQLPTKSMDNMSKEEQFFVQEINFLRSNPKIYAQFVANYLQELENEKASYIGNEEVLTKRIDAAKFVKDYLAEANTLSTLNVNEILYESAVEHGEDCKQNGKLTHWGSDGSTTWQRLQQKSNTIIDGDQYLIDDAEDARESIIKILVDYAVYHRNRTNILLRTDWTDCAVASVGDVGIKKHCWVIIFGKF